jgi:hypothetical protein
VRVFIKPGEGQVREIIYRVPHDILENRVYGEEAGNVYLMMVKKES